MIYKTLSSAENTCCGRGVSVRSDPDRTVASASLYTDPPFERWGSVLDSNLLSSHKGTGDDSNLIAFRNEVRNEIVMLALAETERLGIDAVDFSTVSTRLLSGAPIVMAGHQPLIYHPGITAKTLLLNRIAHNRDAIALDVVIDTDAFEGMRFSLPRLGGDTPMRVEHVLGGSDMKRPSCAHFAEVPSEEEIDSFSCSIREDVALLGLPSSEKCVASYLDAFAIAARHSGNLAEASVIARRAVEAAAPVDHLEISLSALVRTLSFERYLDGIVCDAEEFSSCYNASLACYRLEHHTRSNAQPFPDLRVVEGIPGTCGTCFEIPFWLISRSERSSLFVTSDTGSSGVSLVTESGFRIEEGVHGGEGFIAPKAVALTLFLRLFVSDLFIHGTGGGRYDQVTEDVSLRFYGISLPSCVVASADLTLPFDRPDVTEEGLTHLREYVNRIESHPETIFDALGKSGCVKKGIDYAKAHVLLNEKEALIRDISRADANRKAIGMRIKSINSEFKVLLSPVRDELTSQITSYASALEKRRVLSDRTYSFPLWNLCEIYQVFEQILQRI